MLWKTHILTGASAGLLVAGYVKGSDCLWTATIAAGIAGITAILPDLDTPNSKIGRKIPVMPALIKVTVGHRGAFHSLLGAAVVAIMVAMAVKLLLSNPFVELFYFALAGYLSHIAVDALNPRGCPLFWPLPIHIRIPLVKTGSLFEKMFVFPVMGTLLCWLYWSVARQTVEHFFMYFRT